MESERAAIQVITTASLALEMGQPIHSVVASTKIASDKAGRFVSMPSCSILTRKWWSALQIQRSTYEYRVSAPLHQHPHETNQRSRKL